MDTIYNKKQAMGKFTKLRETATTFGKNTGMTKGDDEEPPMETEQPIVGKSLEISAVNYSTHKSNESIGSGDYYPNAPAPQSPKVSKKGTGKGPAVIPGGGSAKKTPGGGSAKSGGKRKK